MALHKNLTVGDIHVPYQWAYADAAARTGATGFVAGDVGKFARQLDDDTIWMLTATTPTWIRQTSTGGGSFVPTSRQVNTQNGLQGGGDLTIDRTLSPTYGTAVNTVCQGNDSRLSDARTPTAHATSHKSGGSDVVKLDELAAPTDVTTLNATTGQHGLLPKLGGGTTNFLRADGSWAAPSPDSIFGSQFQQGSSDSESSTTSGSYQQKLRVTTPSLPLGTYRIGFYFEWGKSGLTDFASRVQVNDTTTIMEGFEEAADAGADQYTPVGGLGYYTGSGVLNIDLDYHAGGADTARIRRARLEIWRVA